jgi:3',5'-cyclic-nucleotide phosphodiesterase
MSSLLALLLLAAAPAPRAPVFELHTLGVLGGDTDTNLSAFLLGAPGQPATLLIDGGSVTPGLQRELEKAGRLARDASPTARAQATMAALEPLQGFLLTHAHLDHWGGFVDASTLQVTLALGGKPPLPVVGLPEALAALRDHLFASPLWADFTAIPPKSPALKLSPLAPGAHLALAGFDVEDFPLRHAVPSAAFLIRSGGEAYLHLGDTGPSDAVWAAARPLLQTHHLRAVALELSYAATDEKLAALTGHLARGSFLRELAKLAGVPAPSPAEAMSDADALALARALAPAFRDCPVFVIHVKALAYDRVKAEVAALQQAGLNLVLPEQGGRYRF